MRLQRLDLPPRGLAGEGAQAVVDRAIGGLAGVLAARANAAAVILRVEYDADVVSAEAIHDALTAGGVSHVAVHERSTTLEPNASADSDRADHE